MFHDSVRENLQWENQNRFVFRKYACEWNDVLNDWRNGHSDRKF